LKTEKTRRMVGTAILAAIIVVLQSFSSYIKIFETELNLVLIPIVVGSAVYGATTGAFLGLVSAIVILLQPGTAAFYQINFFGTILTVVLKGVASGFLAGYVYEVLRSKKEWLGVYAAAAVCPIVNTAIYGLGLIAFFQGSLFGVFALFGAVNFVLEFTINIICAPIIVRLLKALKIQ